MIASTRLPILTEEHHGFDHADVTISGGLVVAFAPPWSNAGRPTPRN
jgi:hypothetical protein